MSIAPPADALAAKQKADAIKRALEAKAARKRAIANGEKFEGEDEDPDDWEECGDGRGGVYYHNLLTSESVWEKPTSIYRFHMGCNLLSMISQCLLNTYLLDILDTVYYLYHLGTYQADNQYRHLDCYHIFRDRCVRFIQIRAIHATEPSLQRVSHFLFVPNIN